MECPECNANTYIDSKLLCDICGEKGYLYSFDETALQ